VSRTRPTTNRPATATSGAEPMRQATFHALTEQVAAVCERHGVSVWLERDRQRLNAALWAVVHPDLAGTAADPYHGPDEDDDWEWG
jgi:hypothetical protein